MKMHPSKYTSWATLYATASLGVLMAVILAIAGQVPEYQPVGLPVLTKPVEVNLPDPCGMPYVSCGPAPVVGKASWLDYELPDTCAARDWPKGTRLYVQRADDPVIGAECVVRDYGPDAGVFPDRIVDLSRQVFERIAPPLVGVVAVTVVPS